jgi:hypothetical protein
MPTARIMFWHIHIRVHTYKVPFRVPFGCTLLLTSVLLLVRNQSVRFLLDFDKTILQCMVSFRLVSGYLSSYFWEIASDSLLVSFRLASHLLILFCISSDSLLVSFRLASHLLILFCISSDSLLVSFWLASHLLILFGIASDSLLVSFRLASHLPILFGIVY